jgi:hypothetical protein
MKTGSASVRRVAVDAKFRACKGTDYCIFSDNAGRFPGRSRKGKKNYRVVFFMLDILFLSMYKHNSLRHGSLS